MHRSESVILRFSSAIFACLELAAFEPISPMANRISRAFTASRFFLNWTRCQAILLSLSATILDVS
jgi:hypothetical protein